MDAGVLNDDSGVGVLSEEFTAGFSRAAGWLTFDGWRNYEALGCSPVATPASGLHRLKLLVRLPMTGWTRALLGGRLTWMRVGFGPWRASASLSSHPFSRDPPPDVPHRHHPAHVGKRDARRARRDAASAEVARYEASHVLKNRGQSAMSPLSFSQVRRTFLDYFVSKGHEAVRSAPLPTSLEPNRDKLGPCVF